MSTKPSATLFESYVMNPDMPRTLHFVNSVSDFYGLGKLLQYSVNVSLWKIYTGKRKDLPTVAYLGNGKAGARFILTILKKNYFLLYFNYGINIRQLFNVYYVSTTMSSSLYQFSHLFLHIRVVILYFHLTYEEKKTQMLEVNNGNART